ncbi:MAG: sulfite exporter TauE/SafE family protein [Bradyrhizobiaceae bacterium]|nr:sulfite exporter TauE/SafE family protein [Bradyrhizobiaceae bacterium]
MLDTTLVFIGGVFALAGFVKGMLGLGLPTLSMAILVFVMQPVDAAAILLLPSLVTNVWQMVAGPSLRAVARRLWPTMVAACAGTWTGAGLMTGMTGHYGTPLLGATLIAYAAFGLTGVGFNITAQWEPFAGPAVGVVTGVITAATGVFVIPAVPYLHAIGLGKEELVQALGLSFTVSTAALAVNVATAGAIDAAAAGTTIVALVVACAGMWIGRAVRLRMAPAAFRGWFFLGLLALGLYLTGSAVLPAVRHML